MELLNLYGEILGFLGGNVDKLLTIDEARKINTIFREIGVVTDFSPGYNLLIMACNRDHYEFAKYLLDHGANPNIITKFSFPLKIAAGRGFVDIVNLLLHYDADINQISEFGISALHNACSNNNIDIVKILINSGANVNIGIKYANTPIHVAAKYATDPQIFDMLFFHGADIEFRDQNGKTPLISACASKNYNGVSRLISYGCDLDTQDNEGHTALMIASRNGCLKIVELLVDNECDINMRSPDGYTALDFAKMYKKSDI